MTDDLERAIGPDRRTFVKRLVMGAAFAAPVVSSFTMTGVEAVFGAERGAIIGLANCNTIPPGPPLHYPTELVCDLVDLTGATLTFDDGPVHIEVVVPPAALPTCTSVCLFKGDLAALASVVPPGETPKSAYSVRWRTQTSSSPDALAPITLTVTDPTVHLGDPIYKLDKTTGQPTPAGTAGEGTWAVTFVEDPEFVVTDPGTSDGDGDDDRDEGHDTAAQAPVAIEAKPEFTG